MGKPGAKKTDQIVSATPGDVHIIMVPSPGGPVPTPIPHPCTSIIKDKVAETVKVMGLPGAVKGSVSQHTPPHIPMGPGPFQKPPKNKGEIVTASSNVFYEGKAAAMLGDTGKMCADPADAPVGKVIGTAATVLIGGGGQGSDAARAAAAEQAMLAAGAACHAWILANMPPGADRENAHRAVCTATGHPVDVATGKLFTHSVELVLKGRMPLQVARNYSSARPDRGPLGRGWRHNWQVELFEGDGFVALRDENGRYISFVPVAPGATANAIGLGRFTLHRGTSGEYSVRFPSGLAYRFGRGQPFVGGAVVHSVVAVEDAWGNTATLDYDVAGRLRSLTDSAGRVVTFIYDSTTGLMVELRCQDRAQDPARVVCRYFYHDALLVAAEDEGGHRRSYEYVRGHLLSREIDRNGHSFYFAYDDDGWCVETWGDGGLLYRSLRYDRARRRTVVTDGLGYRRLYKWTEHGVVVEQTDHRGHTLRYQYNDYLECTAEENGRGDRWTYEYDDAGRMTSVVTPTGATLQYEWDPRGRLVEKVDANGGVWSWSYSDDGRVTVSTDPLGFETVEVRDHRGDLVAIRGPDGRETRLAYDAAGNCIELINGDGLRVSRTFNSRGDLLREYDEYGTRLDTAYDNRGFQTFVRHRGRGETRFVRDAEGRIVRLTDSRGRTFEYEYLPFLSRITRVRQTSGLTLADGQRIVPEGAYTYDIEGRLVRVESNGRVVAELEYAEHAAPVFIRFADGREQRFERDPQGIVTGLWENGELVFTQEADAVGRIVRRVTGDGEELRFEFDAAGRLVAGESNGASLPLRLERDALGRIVEQAGGAGEFAFDYDPIGYCTRYQRQDPSDELQRSLGIGFTLGRRTDSAGRELAVTVEDQPAVTLSYDGRERLTGMWFAGGESHVLAYGARDMPVERRVTIGERQRRRDRFDVDDWNLIGRWDRLDGDAAVYERDDRGRLTAVINKNVADETTGVHRWGYDASGDRVVSAFGKTAAYCAFDAHRPITCGGEHLVYDRRGRVIRRIDAELRVTEFHWNSVNQLRRVDLPDGVWFEYDYDVLGRRVAKRRGDVRSGETTVARFEWIDNHLVHECTFDGDAPRHRHYLYHPRSFAPLACISGGEDGWRVNSVTTDLRGAPIAVFSPGGEELWAADVLPFGEREVRRESEEMPLVLPGQYADAETGLLYNNARYYNPSTATYLTPDLIGLAGGDNPYQYVTDPLSEIDPLGLNPEQIALGLSTYRMPLPNGKSAVVPDVLTRFAADPAGDGSVRAGTWTSFDPVEDPDTGLNDFGASIKKAMHDAKTIHFNLEGMGNDPNRASVADILSNPDPSRYKPPSTEWELATVLSDPELRKKTVFYDRPGVESKQIPCIT